MPADAMAASTRSTNSDSAPLLDDQPSRVDLLNFGQFVDALQSVILDAQTKTPIIIGVFGRWGTGKSTLMRMLQERVEQAGETTVWFNAWLYNKEDEIWAALLQSLTSTLSRKLGLRKKIRFAFGVHDRGIDTARLMYVVPGTLFACLGILLLCLAGYLLTAVFPTDAVRTLAQFGGIGGSAALFYVGVLRPAARAVRARIGTDFALYKSVDFQSHIGFLDRFREQFARIVASVPGSGGRVVVFIDDLDRCGADKALEVLDTIKVFLDVPGCVFVLGVDLAVVRRALEKKYPDDAIAQAEYLSKIVQLPFHLPPLMDADLRGYLEKLEVTFPDDRCREVLLGGLARNPRELKRVINTYALNWYLARARSGVGDVAPVRLAKIVVIQQSFGRLFDLLRDQPSLLGVLERALRSRLADPTQDAEAATAPDAALAEITVVNVPGGLALPPSLQPFAEDPNIRNLLTMHPLVASDDANFGTLSADELLLYFNLTHRFAARGETGSIPAPRAEPASASVPVPQAPIDISFDPRYDVIERIAFGGTSAVYLALDRTTQTRVAIKRLQSSLSDDPNWTARFEREIRILQSFSGHPNIAGVLGSGTGRDADGRAFRYCVMEHVPGESLQASLARRSTYPLHELSAIFVPILDALAFIHAHGVVHRDIKPSSIVVTTMGVPKLIDFGLAVEHLDGQDDLTSVGTIVGTPAYMSPEQLTGQPFGPQSDLFSLGVVIYQAATGVNPMRGDTAISTMLNVASGGVEPPSSLNDALPPAFDAFVARMLQPKPERRFHDAATARDACAQALAPVGDPPPQSSRGPESDALTADAVRGLVEASGQLLPGEVVDDVLLIYENDAQRTWIVATAGRLFIVLDDAGTRETGRLIQGTFDRRAALPARTTRTRQGTSIVTFGRYANAWLYSPTLFPDDTALNDALTGMRAAESSTDGPAAS